jgi:hypothetical protein
MGLKWNPSGAYMEAPGQVKERHWPIQSGLKLWCSGTPRACSLHWHGGGGCVLAGRGNWTSSLARGRSDLWLCFPPNCIRPSNTPSSQGQPFKLSKSHLQRKDLRISCLPRPPPSIWQTQMKCPFPNSASGRVSKPDHSVISAVSCSLRPAIFWVQSLFLSFYALAAFRRLRIVLWAGTNNHCTSVFHLYVPQDETGSIVLPQIHSYQYIFVDLIRLPILWVIVSCRYSITGANGHKNMQKFT